MNFKPGFWLSILLVLWTNAFSQKPEFGRTISPRIANYDIRVELDQEEKMLFGKETLFWKNPSGDTIRELRFHLYLNAFKNTQSTFMRKTGRASRRMSDKKRLECTWGFCQIDRMSDANGNDLTESIRFIRPDDDNEQDETVVSVPLPNPVMPFDSIEIKLDFTVKIPMVMARTGYSRDYFFMAQWFPKVGVYEAAGVRFAEKGQWNCHQYHARTEYYADHGVYNVDIEVPAHFIVGSSGVLQKISDNGATKIHSYRAEDVIDFTWTASPSFLVFEDEWEGVSIRLLTNPAHECFAGRYIQAAKNALEYFAQYLEKYPYPTLTIVDPPYHGMFTAGMEYPTLITGGALRGFPAGILMPETFTVHEFTHQYFQQMVANNEQEEPWLDEGFATYWEGRVMDFYYGEKTSTFDCFGIRAGNIEYNRIGFTSMDNPKLTSSAQTGWNVPHGGYGAISYNKTAVWLRTLEGLVGWETMNEIMKTYFQKWKFDHPCGRDFVAVVNEVLRENHGDHFGENMDWFFDQVLYGTQICDYELASISNQKIKPDVGIFGDDCLTGEEEEREESVYRSKVMVYRLGEVKMPVEILVRFENGEEVLETWDGKDRTFELEYESPSRVEWAWVDPEQKIYLDINFNNNSLTLKPKKSALWKWTSSFLQWIQNAMQTASFLV